MPQEIIPPQDSGVIDRRKFLVRSGLLAASSLLAQSLAGCAHSNSSNLPGSFVAGGDGHGVTIIHDPADPIASAAPAKWAVEQLRLTLNSQKVRVNLASSLNDANPTDLCILSAGPNSSLLNDVGFAKQSAPTAAEGLVIAPQHAGARRCVVACGTDARGLVYALSDLADAAALSDDPISALQPARTIAEQPANSIRSVMRMFCSDVEDKAWFYDQGFWQRYLTMLVGQRFNRFNLSFGLGYDVPNNLLDTYLYFAYPFLLSVPGYNVKAVGLPDVERDKNLQMLRFISDECAARGLQFQLGLWTHAYQWNNSPKANYTIDGLTADTHGAYCRDAITLLLKQCPNIAGITFRIHGESGVPEGSYDFWKMVFDGVARSGRVVEIDMHAKGMDQKMIDTALSSGMPLTISPKFWAEHCGLPYHQAAIRATELPKPDQTGGQTGGGLFSLSSGQRSFLRYGYGDLLREDRKYKILTRVWPGTQRFLLWGDPAFAAGYSRAFQFCGGAGGEYFDPMGFKGKKGSGLPGGRQGYVDTSLRTDDDFAKHLYTYRLLGRLLYDPDTDQAVWQRQLVHDYGPKTFSGVEASLGKVSRILPLITTAHCPSAANNNYWPEMYVNMPIVGTSPREPYSDTPSPKRFGTVSPLDPQLFSRVDEFVDELLAGKSSGKYSPLDVARRLQDLTFDATVKLGQAQAAAPARFSPDFRRMEIDVRVQISLGQFFADKLRAAVMYSLYTRTGRDVALTMARSAYHAAREAWQRIVVATADVYAPDITYGIGWFQRGHWSDRLAAIDQDLAAMAQPTTEPATAPVATSFSPEALDSLIVSSMADSNWNAMVGASHTPPRSLQAGAALELQLADAKAVEPVTAVRLFYRHVNQADAWRDQPMTASGGQFSTTIDKEYTSSPFPLQYYFQFSAASGRAWLYPGLGAELLNQPYFVVRPG